MPRTDFPTAHPGDVVRMWRLARKLSQRELGALVGRSQRWVSAVEAGRVALSLSTASAVAAALGCDLSIFGEETA